MTPLRIRRECPSAAKLSQRAARFLLLSATSSGSDCGWGKTRSSSSVSIRACRTSATWSWLPISHATVLLPTPAAPHITRTSTKERIRLQTFGERSIRRIANVARRRWNSTWGYGECRGSSRATGRGRWRMAKMVERPSLRFPGSLVGTGQERNDRSDDRLVRRGA